MPCVDNMKTLVQYLRKRITVLPWLLIIYMSNGWSGVVVILMYLLTWDLIRFVGNPRALWANLSKNNIDAEWLKGKRFIVNALPIIILFLSCMGTLGALLDENLTPNRNNLINKFLIPYLFFILSCVISRIVYIRNAPETKIEFRDIPSFLANEMKEEDLSQYVALKSFATIEEAEEFKTYLEKNNIPSMIYGANRLEHIPEDVLPIRILVRKRYYESAKEYI